MAHASGLLWLLKGEKTPPFGTTFHNRCQEIMITLNAKSQFVALIL